MQRRPASNVGAMELERSNAPFKACLRQAFKPAHLAKNLCTKRDNRIQQTERPERFFWQKTPYHTETLEEEAMWIAMCVPNIARQYKQPADNNKRLNPTENVGEEDKGSFDDPTESKNRGIVESIAKVLKIMHEDKLDP